MSYFVTRLVRCVRLPRTMKNRPAAKGVLLSLADDCHDDGLDAYPSISTLARETEISRRSVQVHLRALQAAGLIDEQRAWSQHRPTTWALQLPAIAVLADPAAVAILKPVEQHRIATLRAHHRQPEVQPVAPLDNDPDVQAATPLDSQDSLDDDDPEVQLSAPEVQLSSPDVQRVAPERYLNGTENKDRTLAPTPSFTRQAKEPNGGNFFVIRKIAIEVLEDADGALAGFDFVERVKQKCADLQIDYGRADGVSVAVVQRACDSAVGWRKLQSIKPKVTSPGKGAPV